MFATLLKILCGIPAALKGKPARFTVMKHKDIELYLKVTKIEQGTPYVVVQYMSKDVYGNYRTMFGRKQRRMSYIKLNMLYEKV